MSQNENCPTSLLVKIPQINFTQDEIEQIFFLINLMVAISKSSNISLKMTLEGKIHFV